MKKIIYGIPVFLMFFVLPLLSRASAPELSRAMDLTYNVQFDEAENLLNGYIAANSQDPMGYVIRGTMWDWKQLVNNMRGALNEKILADYERANKIAFLQWDKDQENVDKMINLGNSYLFLSKKWLDLDKTSRAGLILKKCQKHLDEAAQKDPTRYDAYMANGIFNFYAANIPPGMSMLAGLLGISGNEKLGVDLVLKSADNPNLFQNHALFVLTYMYGQTKKNYVMAQVYLDRLMAKFPGNPHFLFLKGEYAFRANEFEKSRQAFAEFENFCSTHTCVQNYKFLMNYFLANGYIKEGKRLEAAPYAEKAESLNEHQYADRESYVALYRGQILKAQGKMDEAKAYFQKSIAAPKGNPKAKEEAANELKGM
ncbi:MAG: hypothetical protein ACD_73C00064G0002 [uncultured bacterium]|nr:MAG: hypothetical protein ACD_73C00064G0002 [uncultured bacterium]